MSGHLAWAEAVDDLYRSVIDDPALYDDERLAEWMADLGSWGPLPRDIAKELRRAMRVARKLRDRVPERPDADWRAAVDGAIGPAAWRPGLAIVQQGLDESPSPELFAAVKQRLKETTFDRWMEGIGYDEWLEGTR